MTAGAGHVAAILLAAGRSERLADPVPKPFRRVGGRRVIDYSLAALGDASCVDSIVVVVPEAMRDEAEPSLSAAPKVSAVTAGGPSRQQSLARGLARVRSDATVIVVHDAARPMVTAGLVDGVVASVSEGFDGAISAVPLDDAIKEVDEGAEVLGPRSRVGLWRAQTPQAFSRGCLEDSLAQALEVGVVCDDCSEMATRARYRVRVVPGDPLNLKVTRPADLELCERLLAGAG